MIAVSFRPTGYDVEQRVLEQFLRGGLFAFVDDFLGVHAGLFPPMRVSVERPSTADTVTTRTKAFVDATSPGDGKDGS